MEQKVTTPILTVENLRVSYREENKGIRNKNQKREVLHDITFSIGDGEILGLVGESGCGKSTLAKTIIGFKKPDSGVIQQYSQFPQMVFQDPYNSLNPSKKIGWILEEPLKNRTALTKKERGEKVKQMLSYVGLEEQYADRYPHQLSGGQRQRVCIAAALMLEPKLLIADEPVSALDVTIQAQIIELLLHLHKKLGIAILFISHDLRVVYQVSDRVMIMQQGRIVEEGETSQIYFQPKEAYTRTLLESAGIM